MHKSVQIGEQPFTTIVAAPDSAGEEMLRVMMGFEPQKQPMRHPILVTQDWTEIEGVLLAQALVAKEVQSYSFAITDDAEALSQSEKVHHLKGTAAQRLVQADQGHYEFETCSQVTTVVAEPDSIGANAMRLLTGLRPEEYPILVTHDWEEINGVMRANVQIATEIRPCSCVIGEVDAARAVCAGTNRVYLLQEGRNKTLLRPERCGLTIDPSRYPRDKGYKGAKQVSAVKQMVSWAVLDPSL